jgi:hypothetical protein
MTHKFSLSTRASTGEDDGLGSPVFRVLAGRHDFNLDAGSSHAKRLLRLAESWEIAELQAEEITTTDVGDRYNPAMKAPFCNLVCELRE